MTGKKEMQARLAAKKVIEKPVNTRKSALMVALLNLPTLKAFGSTLPIATSVEKGQITEISITAGGKATLIYKDVSFVEGLNPNQAEFIFNAIVGGAGTARGARQLGFAQWITQISPKFKALGFSKSPEEYEVVVNYAKRGGIMVYNIKDLITLCGIKTNAARESFKRYPRQADEPKSRDSKITEAEVTVSL